MDLDRRAPTLPNTPPAGHEQQAWCVHLEMESMLVVGVTASLVIAVAFAILRLRSQRRRSEPVAPGRTVIAANLVGSRRRRGL
jgi:hypothetical protein